MQLRLLMKTVKREFVEYKIRCYFCKKRIVTKSKEIYKHCKRNPERVECSDCLEKRMEGKV